MALFVFYAFVVLVVASALMVVTTRNVVHAAFALMVTLFSVAVFYVFLGAGFLAAIQVLVYVGGILVLVLFGVMMTSGRILMRLRAPAGQLIPAGLVGLILLGLLFWAMGGDSPWKQILLTRDPDGDAAARIRSAQSTYPVLKDVRTKAISPRLAIEFRAVSEPKLPQMRRLSKIVEESITAEGLSRFYVMQVERAADSKTRYQLVVEKRVTSLIDGYRQANITDAEQERLTAALQERLPEEYVSVSVERPPMLLAEGVTTDARRILTSELGLIPAVDLRSVVGLGDSVMMGEYLLPFEIVSVILLVALIGAAVVSRKGVEA